jgi:endonuclease/exonuclease/phosphatase family metal-dependent hydrolase
MKKLFLVFCQLLFLFSVAFSATPYVNDIKKLPEEKKAILFVSWNIQNLGKSKSDEELSYISTKIKFYDIVAIQEVSTSEFGSQAVAKLADNLDRTGSDWDYVISNSTSGDGSERYAYLFKKNRVKLKEKAQLEASLSEVMNREPFRAIFIFKNIEYYFFNLHLVPTDKHPQIEVNRLEVLTTLYKGKRIIMLGDFNLSQSDNSFNSLKSKGIVPSLINKKTSLKMKPVSGQVLNMEYDNFYISSQIKFKNSSVIYFFEDFKDLQSARKISDHCPIKISIK